MISYVIIPWDVQSNSGFFEDAKAAEVEAEDEIRAVIAYLGTDDYVITQAGVDPDVPGFSVSIVSKNHDTANSWSEARLVVKPQERTTGYERRQNT